MSRLNMEQFFAYHVSEATPTHVMFIPTDAPHWDESNGIKKSLGPKMSLGAICHWTIVSISNAGVSGAHEWFWSDVLPDTSNADLTWRSAGIKPQFTWWQST